MASVQQALEKLNDKVGKLEGSIETLEGTLSGQQRDMFGRPIQKTVAQDKNEIDRVAVTQRLDKAIEQVEMLLEEAS